MLNMLLTEREKVHYNQTLKLGVTFPSLNKYKVFKEAVKTLHKDIY